MRYVIAAMLVLSTAAPHATLTIETLILPDIRSPPVNLAIIA